MEQREAISSIWKRAPSLQGGKASQVKSLGQLIYDMFECLTTPVELKNTNGAIKELETIFGKNKET